MSNLDKLLEKGAQVVGGDLILRHKVMGQFRNGDFFVTPEGMNELEIVDVVVAQDVTVVKEVKKTTKKTTKVEEQITDSVTASAEDVTIDV
jgi:hypothetical protein